MTGGGIKEELGGEQKKLFCRAISTVKQAEVQQLENMSACHKSIFQRSIDSF